MAVDVGGVGEAKSEPNVVPLCDILLVLLIIFMVVTPMIQMGPMYSYLKLKIPMNNPNPEI